MKIRPVAPEGSFILELTVRNPTAVALPDTVLEATIGGAELSFAWSTAGDCAGAAEQRQPEAAEVICTLGDLAAGQMVDVRILATAPGRSTLDRSERRLQPSVA